MKKLFVALIISTVFTNLSCAEDLTIPVQKTSPTTVLVGWRPKEARQPFTNVYGTEKTVAFGNSGDKTINQVISQTKMKVVSIVPLLAPTSGSSAVCGAWIIFRPE